VERFWTTARTYFEKKRTWLESNIADVDAEDVDRSADELFRAYVKLGKEFDRLGEKRITGKRLAENLQKDVKEFQTVTVPLMLLVCNPGMKDRHWSDIEKITGISVPLGVPLNAATLMSLGLQNYVKEIEDTCVSASKEYSLGVSLNRMEEEWKHMIFDTKEYRTTGTRILHAIDEIQQLLDDQIVKIQAMRGSRYIKPFAEQVAIWESTLLLLQDTLDNWLKVQATWLYLEPIFSSEDIMRQMPTEGTMFRAVDSTWRVSMSQTYEDPNCVTVVRRPGFLSALIEANKKLEIIQKGLNDYLETKRLAFPRFFFLSNDELLEILAETKDPLRVQPHLKKW
jgi:dynein heavy chain